MRPCRQCRTPIENRDATCPHCGAAQDGAPQVNSGPVPPQSRRESVRQFFTGLSDLGLTLSLVPVGTVILLAFVGAVGYALAGNTGAGVGVVVVIALIIGVVIWAESGG